MTKFLLVDSTQVIQNWNFLLRFYQNGTVVSSVYLRNEMQKSDKYSVQEPETSD